MHMYMYMYVMCMCMCMCMCMYASRTPREPSDLPTHARGHSRAGAEAHSKVGGYRVLVEQQHGQETSSC